MKNEGSKYRPIKQLINYSGRTFSKQNKLLLILPLALLLVLTMTSTNQDINKMFQISKMEHIEYVTAVWAFDLPINIKELEMIDSRSDAGITHLKILCSNIEKCQICADAYNSTSLQIQIIQLKAIELSKNTPLADWVASHPINKIKSLTCFPAYFHKIMYLSALWKYGGIFIDMALNVKDNSDLKDDFVISSSFEGCLLDQSKSNILLCNLPPEHAYTEVLIGEVSKLFIKDPKTCIFDHSLETDMNLTTTVSSNVGYNIPSSDIKFGLLKYGTTLNLGDEMQSIAAAHLLPHINTYIDRDSFINADQSNLTYISNGLWNGGILYEHKHNPNLIPVPVAVHIPSTSYSRITKSVFTAMAPIGARDLSTHKKFIENGIDSIFTGCISLWMKNPYSFTNIERKNEVIIVDLNMKLNPLPEFLTNIKYVSHRWGRSSPNIQVVHYSTEERLTNTYEFLMQYALARVVVTTRLEVAIPCVAVGTPVIYVNSKELWDSNDETPTPRVSGLLDLFHTVDMYQMNEKSASEYLKSFNWESPPPNPNPDKVEVLKRGARQILERIPELAVSLKVFELI